MVISSKDEFAGPAGSLQADWPKFTKLRALFASLLEKVEGLLPQKLPPNIETLYIYLTNFEGKC